MEAKEAAELYTSVFPDSKITNITTLHDTPSGDCDIVSFELSGQKFMAISAGPLFKFNPSISFHVKCKAKNEKKTARVTEAFLKMKKFDIDALKRAYRGEN